MSNINYNAYELVSSLAYNGKTISEISQELNLEKSFVSKLLKQARNEYILSFDEKMYPLVFRIDKLLSRKKKKKIINNFGGKKDIIFNLICDGKSSNEICDMIGIGVEGYINFLKYMYYELFLYGNYNEKIYLAIIRSALIDAYKLFKSNILIHTSKESMVIEPSKMRLRGINDEIILTDSYVSNLSNIECGNTFKFIVISDLHAGSKFENFGYLDEIYNEAAKMGINDIFISGDIAEGCHANYNRCKNKYSSTKAQVNHILEDYPYDKNIKNHILLGNHEAFPIIIEGYDMCNDLKARSDFDVSGYRSAYYKINNEYISLKHEISRVLNEISDNVVLFNFLGHSHLYKCNYDGRYVTFRVPTCSDLESNSENNIVNRGYLLCEVNFNSSNKAQELSVVYKDFDNRDTNITLERKLTK